MSQDCNMHILRPEFSPKTRSVVAAPPHAVATRCLPRTREEAESCIEYYGVKVGTIKPI